MGKPPCLPQAQAQLTFQFSPGTMLATPKQKHGDEAGELGSHAPARLVQCLGLLFTHGIYPSVQLDT